MLVKYPSPVSFLNKEPDSKAETILKIYLHAVHLKQLYRQGWLKRGRDIPPDKCESVNDHTMGTIILLIFIKDEYFPTLDILKVLLMMIFHDFPEAVAGDSLPGVSAKDKYHRELAALEEILSGSTYAEKYIALWKEFEKGESQEAHLAKEIDILERTLQARIYYLQNGMGPSEFIDEAYEKLVLTATREVLESSKLSLIRPS